MRENRSVQGSACRRGSTAMKLTIAVAVGLLLGWAGFRFFSPRPVSREDRMEAYRVAIEAGQAERGTWPGSPEGVIREFWEAASRKDYARLKVLSPGSVESDFRTYYDRWTPSPAKSVGKPEPHPRNGKIALYPTVVSFPGFPNKTVKMAVKRAEDGRYIIDGRNTIWW